MSKGAHSSTEYNKNWAKNHRAQRYVSSRKWRTKSPNKVKAHNHRWYLKHAAQKLVSALNWQRENPTKKAAIDSRRRERENNTNTAARSDINILSQLVSSSTRLKCGICGTNMPKNDRTIDHVIPLSKGGTGNIWNLRIVHRRCNSMKGATMPDELNFADGAERICNKTSEDGENARRPKNRHSKTPHQTNAVKTI